MKNRKIDYFIRAITLPFIFCLVFIALLIKVFGVCRQYMLYGGEVALYEKDDRVFMRDIYQELKNLHDEI